MASSFQDFSDDVYRWAFRVLGRHEDALDVVQEVFLVWNRESRRGNLRTHRGWLRTTTVNRAIDVKRRRRVADAAKFQAGAHRSTDSPHASLASEHADLQASLTAALAELTASQLAVLTAKIYDEMTFGEIANELGISVPTAKTHYLRALRAMRDKLRPTWATELTQ